MPLFPEPGEGYLELRGEPLTGWYVGGPMGGAYDLQEVLEEAGFEGSDIEKVLETLAEKR